jgi:hypothetical protein
MTLRNLRVRNLLHPDRQERHSPSGLGQAGDRDYLSRDDIRRRLDAWEAADPQYFARLKKRYGKPKTK